MDVLFPTPHAADVATTMGMGLLPPSYPPASAISRWRGDGVLDAVRALRLRAVVVTARRLRNSDHCVYLM
jgi:hypothetical protein